MHFPRVTIGHWPPSFYAIQAVMFSVAGRSSEAALGLQALIGGLACAWPAVLVQRRLGLLAGAASGLFVLASPTLMFLMSAVMLDTALGVLFVAAALCWARFATGRGLVWAILFAAVSTTAILLKANGFALALLPLIYAAITRDIRPLLTGGAWFAASLVAVAVLPWYALTWSMNADGFNYKLGWDYTSRALPAYAGGMVATLGVVGLAGFTLCVGRLVSNGCKTDSTVAALAAGTLALLAFQLVAPADVSTRYLVALVSSAALPVSVGLSELRRWQPLQRRVPHVVPVLLLVAAALIFVPPRISPFGMPAIAERIIAAEPANPFVLVAGTTRAEGALIAAFAERDPQRAFYVLRATQMFASGGFMGQGYATRFLNSAEMRAWFDQSGIGWLVLENSMEAQSLAHNVQVAQVAADAGWKLVSRQDTREGDVLFYQLGNGSAPDQRQVQELLSRVRPNTSFSLVEARR